MTARAHPPFDVELESALNAVPAYFTRLEPDSIAELHIWTGGFHGFQAIVPTAAVSHTAVQTRESWVRRVLAS